MWVGGGIGGAMEENGGVVGWWVEEEVDRLRKRGLHRMSTTFKTAVAQKPESVI